MSGADLALIQEDIAKGLIDEAIARQRQLPPPVSQQQAAAYARVRAEIAERLSAQGHAAGVFDLLQPYDTAPSRARLPVAERALVSLRLGEAYRATLNYPSALSLLSEAIKMASLASDRKLEADAQCSLGRVYFHLGEYTIALESLQQAHRHYLRAGDLKGEARCNLYLGMIFSALGDFETSIENYHRAISIAEKLQDNELWTEATVNLGTSYLLQGRLRKAVTLYESAVDAERKHLAIYTYNHLAHSLILCGNWSRAQQLLETSLALSRESQEDQGEALALGLFGMLYTLTDRLQTARHTLVSSIELCRQIHSKEGEAFALAKLGQVYLKTAEYEPACVHLTSALELALSINRTGLAVEAEIGLAEVALEEGNLQRAEQFLNTVQKRLVKHPNILLEGRYLYVQGKLNALCQGRPELYFSRAIEIFEAISMPLEKGFCFLERAKSLMATKDSLIKAAADLERAAELFHTIGASYLLPEVSRLQKQVSAMLRTGSNLTLIKEKIYEERRQMHNLLKSCRSRETLLKEVAEGLRRHVQADLVAVYEVSSDGECVFVSGTSDSMLLKNLQERLVLESNLKDTTGWVKGRSIDEPIYIDALQLSPEKRLIFLIWTVPPKLVHKDLIRALLDIVGELIAMAAQQEGRRVEFSAADRGRLKNFKYFPELIYAGREMAELIEQILRIHSSDLTVLITSESGTGKDLVARAIHAASERRDRPFLPFNCTATPHEIVEAQLFGYRKGAFTGANFDYEGVIRAASGGTLLLDEIGDLHLSVQPKLLRFLQEGEIQPIGYVRPIKVDVRIIASTNRDLEAMVERGEFREDLYHRLNIIRLSIPPLRQRREEIALLAQFFLRQAAQRAGKELAFSSEVLQLLESYDWPGNVRQLKNEIDRIAAFAGQDDTIEKFHLSPEIVQGVKRADKGSREVVQTGLTLAEILMETEREVIARTLKQFKGNIRRSAALLGISRKGLYDKIKRLKIRHSVQ